MGKKRSFSIYLLKTSFNASNALKAEHSLEAASATKLPIGASLYVSDTPETEPWWKAFWGIRKNLKQLSKGAIVFLPLSDRCFALTFGHTYHNLKSESYEYDFGLMVTLNSLDPEKLKSTDVLEPSVAKRQRIQTPLDSDLTYFDFDRDSSIIKSLTGKVKEEYRTLFDNATGASNLKITSDVQPDALLTLCGRLLGIYNRDDYKRNFPGIHNISPIKDPRVLGLLNQEMIGAFVARSNSIVLSIPEIVEHGGALHVKFYGNGRSQVYDDVRIENYYEYLEDSTVSIESLKSHDMAICDDDGNTKSSFSIYKSILFDCLLDNKNYHFCEGNWYCVESSYITILKNGLDRFFRNTSLPNYIHSRESEYNKSVSFADSRYVCLDATSISPRGQKAVEPCDLYFAENNTAKLFHIKVSTRSALLSHLFNQGINSIQLIRLQSEARDKLKELIRGRLNGSHESDYIAPIDSENIEVVFGIVTSKDASRMSDNLPLFSRISLMRVFKELQLMKINTAVEFIPDTSVEANDGQN